MTLFKTTVFQKYYDQYPDHDNDQCVDQCEDENYDRFHLHLLDQTDSTNRVAWEMLAWADGPMRVVVIADRQTAGRGQWGRSWQSELGGLYLSLGLILNPSRTIDPLNLIPFFTAWGVAEALRKNQIPVFLKWPNDLLLDRHKLGGILVEIRQGKTVSQNDQIPHASQKPHGSQKLVIGIGLNWENNPPEFGIALKDYQQHHNLATIAGLEHLAAIVLRGLFAGLTQGYSSGASSQTSQTPGESMTNLTSLARFIEQYDRLLAYRGEWISTGSEVGKVLGITETGALRVDVNGVEQTFLPGSLRLGLR